MSFQHLTREDLNLEQTSKCTIIVSRITSRRTTGTLKAVEKCKKEFKFLFIMLKRITENKHFEYCCISETIVVD